MLHWTVRHNSVEILHRTFAGSTLNYTFITFDRLFTGKMKQA